jgi:hypothetical protein
VRAGVAPISAMCPRLLRAVAAAATSGLLAGCAIDTLGTLGSRVTHAESAVVVDLYTLGAHLRTRADDRGLTIGLARRSYVFTAESAGVLAPGWHLLRVPLPPAAAVAQHVASLGLEARAGPVDYGLMLGLRVATVLARAPAGTDVTLALDYTPANPELTRLQVCKEFDECGMEALLSH